MVSLLLICYFAFKAENDFAISTILKDDSSAMTTVEEDEDSIGILRLDPSLEPFKDHLRYRTRTYVDQKKLFENFEGSLEEFAQGEVIASSL